MVRPIPNRDTLHIWSFSKNLPVDRAVLLAVQSLWNEAHWQLLVFRCRLLTAGTSDGIAPETIGR